MSIHSGYLTIVEQISASAKEFILPSRYEAGIAATCVRSLAKRHRKRNVNVRLYGRTIIVWQGTETRIEFTPPPFPRMGPRLKLGRPLGSLGRKGPQRETAGVQTSREGISRGTHG